MRSLSAWVGIEFPLVHCIGRQENVVSKLADGCRVIGIVHQWLHNTPSPSLVVWDVGEIELFKSQTQTVKLKLTLILILMHLINCATVWFQSS